VVLIIAEIIRKCTLRKLCKHVTASGTVTVTPVTLIEFSLGVRPPPFRMLRRAARGFLSAAKQHRAFPAPIFAVLQAKDAELKAAAAELTGLRAAAAAERAAAAAELTGLRVAAAAERAAKDAELKDLRAAMGTRDAAFSDLRLIAQRDATALAVAKHEGDTARRIVGVRASLEVCIADLWAEYGGGNKTRGTSDRLRKLAGGKCPPLVEYVHEAAEANGIDPRKALEQLPELYHALSAPMHAAGFEDDVETPIDAILNGDATTLLLASCLYKMTRRELRLYRISDGERVPFQLKLKEPPVPPLK